MEREGGMRGQQGNLTLIGQHQEIGGKAKIAVVESVGVADSCDNKNAITKSISYMQNERYYANPKLESGLGQQRSSVIKLQTFGFLCLM
ncbi:hypothetical protein GOP47_0000036 [Adiantum capillus-veneris]|uniref:Uncharacterized protein n=1 Tax=Adiantum capillus-veneris TaxID=13818 RepID=A0A9D4VCT1_ADICA|nr:hypothetical protein GOP47_0000036 [Adiantum capillus-veneris]